MHKWLKGYFTIEASFILPIVLFLYMMIILAALFMYCRCAISQDTFLLGMRAERFTYGEGGYGEVIYGEEAEEWQAEDYVKERLGLCRETYPGYPYTIGTCVIDADYVNIQVWRRGYKEPVNKRVRKMNPVEILREGRKV